MARRSQDRCMLLLLALFSLTSPCIFGQLTVVSAANFAPALAPGSAASVFGSAFTSSSGQSATPDGNGRFPFSFQGVTVTVNSQECQLFYVSPTQINFLIPPNAVVGQAQASITTESGSTLPALASITAHAPAIFQILRSRGAVEDSITGQLEPFDVINNSRLSIFASGLNSAGDPVQVSAYARLANGSIQKIQVDYAGPQGQYPGLDQINVTLSQDLDGQGEIRFFLMVGTAESNHVPTIVRPANNLSQLTITPGSAPPNTVISMAGQGLGTLDGGQSLGTPRYLVTLEQSGGVVMTATPNYVSPSEIRFATPYDPLPDGSNRTGDFTVCLTSDGRKICSETPLTLLTLGTPSKQLGATADSYFASVLSAIPPPSSTSVAAQKALSFAQGMISSLRAQVAQVTAGQSVALPVFTPTGLQTTIFNADSLGKFETLLNNSASAATSGSGQLRASKSTAHDGVGVCSAAETSLLNAADAYRTLDNLGSALRSISGSKLAQGAMCFVDLNTDGAAGKIFDISQTVQSVSQFVLTLAPIWFKRVDISPPSITLATNSSSAFTANGIFGPQSSTIIPDLIGTAGATFAKKLLENTSEVEALHAAFDSLTLELPQSCKSLLPPQIDLGGYADAQFDSFLDQLVDLLMGKEELVQLIQTIQDELLGTDFGEITVPLSPATVSVSGAIPSVLQVSWSNECQYQGNVVSGPTPTSNPISLQFFPVLIPGGLLDFSGQHGVLFADQSQPTTSVPVTILDPAKVLKPVIHFTASSGSQSAHEGGTLKLNATSITVPILFDASASTLPPGSVLEWYINNQLRGQQPQFTLYLGASQYHVEARTHDQLGNLSSAAIDITVTTIAPPIASFKMVALSSPGTPAGTPVLNSTNLSVFTLQGNQVGVEFTSLSTSSSPSNIASQVWSVDGKAFGSGATAQTLLGVGTHTITLVVIDFAGNSSTASGLISVVLAGPPQALFDFDWSGQTGSNGSSVSWGIPAGNPIDIHLRADRSTAAGGVRNYRWTSNGALIGTNKDELVSFPKGAFALQLTVSDGVGNSTSASANITLTEVAKSPLAAHFSMSGGGQSGNDGQTLTYSVPVNGNVSMTFTSTSTQGSAAISTYAWKSNGTSICSNSSSCTASFGTPSNSITLTVTDSNSLTSTATGQVNITHPSGPTAHFSMSGGGQSGNDGQTLTYSVPVNGNVSMTFTSTSTQGSAAITTYAWASNGTSICSNSSSCTASFGTPSNSITLTVTDSNSLTSTATGQVNITHPSGPTAHFSMSGGGQSGNDGQTLTYSVPVNGNVSMTFTSTSTQGSAAISTYAWKSNGTSICSNSSSCTASFGTPSNSITLTVTDSNSLTSTATGQVNITHPSGPTAHFSMSGGGQSGNDGQTLTYSVPVNGNVSMTFTSTSTQGSAAITTYAWASNGTAICSNSSSCTASFGTPSNSITLTVTDSNSLTSTATGQVNVTHPSGPTAHFSMSGGGQSGNDGQTLTYSVPVNGNVSMTFTSTSTQGSAAISTYAWKSNGTSICSNSSSCTASFGTPSNSITLTVTDSNSLTSTATGQVNITHPSGPTAHFSMSGGGQSGNDGQTLTYSVPVNGNVSMTFTSTSTQGSAAITTYAWASNGTSICSNSSSCTASFGTPSNSITLTVTDSNSLTSTATGQVNVTHPSGPTAHFSMSGGGQSGNDGQTLTYSVPVNGNVSMTFTSTSTQGSAAITTYAWKSNGTSICSNSSSCTASFGTPSNSITLTVTDSNSLTSTATGQVNVTHPSGPTAHFSMSGGGQSGNDGQTLTYSVPVNGNVSMTFTSTSTQGSAAITTYAWKSNGTSICSNSSSCTASFGTPSNSITLTVTDSNSLTSTATGQVNITHPSGPTAHFSMSGGGQSGNDGQTLTYSVPVNGNVSMTFTSTSTQGSAAITTYAWASNGTAICSNSSSCTASFGTPSNSITLTVTDSNSLTSTATGQVNVTHPSGPTAHFSMSGGGQSGNDGQTLTYSVPVNGNVSMTFTSTSTQGSAAISTYAWKSNGTSICSNSSSCTASFGTPSNSITLTVTDSNSLTSTATGQVNITHPSGPTAHFSMSGGGQSGNDGQTLTYSVPVNGNVSMTFTSTSTQGSAAITTYAWKSNGTSICSNSSSCTASFGTPSNSITLTVTDSNSLTSTATGQVNVTHPSGPTAHFSMSGGGQSGNDGQTLTYSVPVNGNVSMTFTSTSTQGSAAITTYAWKSNGTSICSNSSSCTASFGTPSNSITLTVTDSNSLTSTATGQVNITHPSGPTAHFSMSGGGQSGNDGQTLTYSVPVNGNVSMTFTSTSTQGSAAITTYAWASNGTAICSNSSSCTASFGTPSNSITLTVTDSNSLTSTATGQVNVTHPSGPTAHFSMSGGGQSGNDGQTLTYSVPVNGNVSMTFTSTSTQGSAAISTYAWKSNGTSICSNSSSCTASFGTPSNSITLTVTDSNSLTSTATGQVNITHPSGPTAHFSMSGGGQSGNDGQTLTYKLPVNGSVSMTFTSTSTQGSAAITTYAWKSNGTSICSNSSSCTFPFGTPSNSITLTVTDSNSLTSTATGQVNITH